MSLHDGLNGNVYALEGRNPHIAATSCIELMRPHSLIANLKLDAPSLSSQLGKIAYEIHLRIDLMLEWRNLRTLDRNCYERPGDA